MLLALPNPTYWPRLLLGLLCTLLAIPATAQATSESQHTTPYYLDLRKQAISVPDRKVCVEQVLDGRVGQPVIGFIYRGIYDKKVPVLFRQNMATDILAWLQQQLPARPTDQPVLLCIRQLRVSEVVGRNGVPGAGITKAVSSADILADVYARLPDGYHFMRSVVGHASDPGINMNSDHNAHLALALQYCLLQIAETDQARATRRPARTLAQLPTDKPQAEARPAILRAAVPRSGVYYSLEQFLANQPDTTAVLRVDTLSGNGLSNVLNPNVPTGKASDWKGTIMLKAKVRKANGDRIPAQEVWGFSDGHQAYLRQSNDYRPLIRQDDFYTFVGAAPVDMTAANQRARDNAARMLVGFGAGMSSPEGTTGKPMVFALDTRTGQVAPFPTPSQVPRADTAFVYVYRPLGGAPEPQRLLLDDREVGQLRPGQYLELAWPHVGRPMRLTVGMASGPALLVAPSTSTPNYVKLMPGAARSPWQWIPVRQGEAEVDALEKPRN